MIKLATRSDTLSAASRSTISGSLDRAPFFETERSTLVQPAQLLQVRQALSQQHATQVAAQQAEMQKRIEAEATKRAEELVKIEKERQKQKSAQGTNAATPDEDDTTSQGSAGGRSQGTGARKRKATAEANAENAKVEKERDELREALDLLEAHLGTGARTRQYDSEDGRGIRTRASRVEKSAVTRVPVLRSVSKKGARSKEAEIVDLDAEESVFEQVVRLITHQAGARGCFSPEIRKIRQSPRLSAKSDKSAGSDMRSGSNPPKHKLKTLSFDDALPSPTPEEQKARGRVEARK